MVASDRVRKPGASDRIPRDSAPGRVVNKNVAFAVSEARKRGEFWRRWLAFPESDHFVFRHAIRPALMTIRLKFERHLPFIRAAG
jgi:hypothetical protein